MIQILWGIAAGCALVSFAGYTSMILCGRYQRQVNFLRPYVCAGVGITMVLSILLQVT